MSFRRKLLLLPAGLLLLGGLPSLAQMQDAPIEGDIPGESIPAEPAPVEAIPSEDSGMTPETSSDVTADIGGTGPSGPLSLVQCGPSGAAFVVTKVPVGCHVLGVNSPPGQAENADTP